jgi:uncharacterized protein (DUF1684 family)
VRSVNLARGIIALCAAVVAAGCAAREVPYADEINEWHATKDRFMRESDESPIPADRRATFPPLSYFPIEPEYRVPAQLTVARGDVLLEIPTSTGLRRQHRRIGKLQFTLKGQPLTLTAFVEVGRKTCAASSCRSAT